MDFLRIRRQARERAAGRAEGAAAGSPATPEEPRPPAAAEPEPAPGPAASDAEALEGALAERLQGAAPVPPAEPPAAFTTWRPGSGAPPPIPVLPTRPAPAVNPADFALVRPAGAAHLPALERVRPPAPAPRDEPADALEGFFYSPAEATGLAGEVGGLPPPGEEAVAPAEEGAREEYLTFLLGGEEYAVAIERVREVLKCPPITEVPRAPAHVLGVVTVRGEVVAVFEPRRRLGLPSAPPPEGGGRIVIVDAGDGPCGLLVDAVASVVRLRPGSIEPCPQGIGGASQEYLAGIGRERDRLFTVLDLGALLRRTPGPARRPAEGRAHGGA